MHNLKETFLLGHPVTSITLINQHQSYTPMYCNVGMQRTVVGQLRDIPQPLMLGVKIVTHEPEDFIDYLQDSKFNSVGNMIACEHCTHSQPTGAALCTNCNAPMPDERLVPTLYDYMPTSIEVADVYVGPSMPTSLTNEPPAPTEVPVVFTFNEIDVGRAWYHGIADGMLAHNFLLASNKYMCQWCGTVNYDGEPCRACAGTRMLLDTLVSMKHVCVFCRKRFATGSIWCMSCGSSMTGASFHTYMAQLEKDREERERRHCCG